MRRVIVGINSATSFTTFLSFVHDALSVWWRMSDRHSVIPYFGLMFILAKDDQNNVYQGKILMSIESDAK
ncbi:hypothetical protein, partial [Amphritea sp.]|uniref:hypothetical protein n=1 Tax=Amphritea sp. TaxID=1872502 RepID=UPI003D138D36